MPKAPPPPRYRRLRLIDRGDKRRLHFGLPGRQVPPAHTVVPGPRSDEPDEANYSLASAFA